MISKLFVYAQDTESGIEGWRPKSNEEFMPGDPLLVAHDVLEHFANDTGTLEDELRALGAFNFIRIDSGMALEGGMRQDRASILASLVYDTVSDAMHGPHLSEIIKPPRTTRLNEDLYGDWSNALMDKAVKEALTMLGNELDRDADDYGLRDAFCSEEAGRRILGWLRIGYRGASRRFRNDSCSAADLMKSVRNQVAEINNTHEPEYGDELRVSASIAQWRAVVTYMPAARETAH